MIEKKFGQRLKEIRINKTLSQEQISSLSKINRVQISKIENGLVNVTLETINRLAISLNTDIKDLFDFDSFSKPKPFIKWVGGKTQLLAKIKELMPRSFNKYYEPFVGGGALLFSLKPAYAVINDANSELYFAFKCFQNNKDFNELITKLNEHEKNHSEEYYYKIRQLDRLPNFNNLPISDRAARLIYLNKSCFNGLYRVNKKGYNNVPSGKKVKVSLFNQDNFLSIKDFFSKSIIKIQNQDFAKVTKNATKDDFVYFDPPYDPYPDKNGFVDYSSEKFNKDEQIRLRDTVIALTEKGVKVMVSNHNTKFINNIYKDFNIHIVSAKRLINSKASGRGLVEEVIITNY